MKKIVRQMSKTEKIRKQQVMDIIAVIREYPGINVNRIREATGLNWMTVRRRLETLEAGGVVECDAGVMEYKYTMVERGS